jgi:hypothetical protein
VHVLVELHYRQAFPWIPPHRLAIINIYDNPIDEPETEKVTSLVLRMAPATLRFPLLMQTAEPLQLFRQ